MLSAGQSPTFYIYSKVAIVLTSSVEILSPQLIRNHSLTPKHPIQTAFLIDLRLLLMILTMNKLQSHIL
ncbi:hypothetical protein D3C79_902970 [compost metagenome]